MFQGAPSLHDGLSRATSTPFLGNFWYKFSDLIFEQRLVPKGLKMRASKHQKITHNSKTHPQNTPTVKTCKKTLSGRDQTSEIDDNYTLFTVFPKAQGSRNDVGMGAQIEPRGTQKHRKAKKRAFKKQKKSNTAKSWLLGVI